MSAFKPQQRHLTIHGRVFHFVSYEGQPANTPRKQVARPAMWYLMVEGRRCPAMPCDPTQTEPEIDRFLSRWAMDNALGPVERPAEGAALTASRVPVRRPLNWWGPN
jgi:hypothetical protein